MWLEHAAARKRQAAAGSYLRSQLQKLGSTESSAATVCVVGSSSVRRRFEEALQQLAPALRLVRRQWRVVQRRQCATQELLCLVRHRTMTVRRTQAGL
jgi:hypothetical protein